MSLLTPDDAVVVSRESMQSDDPRAVIDSNVYFVNALRSEYLRLHEISRCALCSYYVDYYLVQVENGGFSQFVYNSQWTPRVRDLVREGFKAMGARKHLALFRETETMIESLGESWLLAYCESGYFGENPDRDALNAVGALFHAFDEDELIAELNNSWLRQLPDLVVLSQQGMKDAVLLRAAAVPNREERILEAQAAEPRYLKLIRVLCAEAGHELVRPTGGDPDYEYRGEKVFIHVFLTDRGHYFMLEADGKAMMFDRASGSKLVEIDVLE